MPSTAKLVNGYFELVKTDYSMGLGALYAYDRQTPDVEQLLKFLVYKNIGIVDDRILQFFSVHQKADEWHTQELINLIEDLKPNDQQKIVYGAISGAKLLWSFLDRMVSCREYSSNKNS